jgi:hypothetical protein
LLSVSVSKGNVKSEDQCRSRKGCPSKQDAVLFLKNNLNGSDRLSILILRVTVELSEKTNKTNDDTVWHIF